MPVASDGWVALKGACMDEDHRIAVRRRVLKEAKVVLRDWSTIDCILRNLSDGGARLEFSDPASLPEQFDVLVVASSTLQPARCAWERGTSVGIKFAGPERPAPARKFGGQNKLGTGARSR